MSDQIAVSCKGVGKTFRIPTSQERTLRGRLLHPTARPTYEDFRAVDTVDFEIQKGEFFGLVGRNGSGKSTLLKVLAGIYKADRGEVTIAGSIAPFIELGVGFNEDLSARDNVFVNGAILGMSRKQILDRFDAIVDFAELHQFMEMRLRNFSSGMLMRLAFAIAVQSGADVLLVDEVLAVGDGRFQRKCHEVFYERKRRGETVVFVTHDMTAVEKFCDRALLIDHGKQIAIGTPDEIVPRYHELNRAIEHATDSIPESTSSTAPSVVIERFEITTPEREPVVDWGADQSILLWMDLAGVTDVPDAIARVLVTGDGGIHIGTLAAPIGDLGAGERRQVEFRLANILGAGQYGLAAEVHAMRDGLWRSMAQPNHHDVHVEGVRAFGAVRLPFDFKVSELAGHTHSTQE